MQIFGHSGGTALVTLLVGVLAGGCLLSGLWGLTGRAVWLPDGNALDGGLTHAAFTTTLRGRRARLAGVALLALGLVFALVALRVWRADLF